VIITVPFIVVVEIVRTNVGDDNSADNIGACSMVDIYFSTLTFVSC
jgi:hypothetical protein